MTEYNESRNLIKEINDIKRRLRAVESGSRLAFSTIEGGAIVERDEEGGVVAQYGTQFDGTHTAASLAGPIPPVPVTPTVEGAVGGLNISWSGAFVDDALTPMDFSRVEIHVSAIENFEVLPENLVATIESPQGGSIFVAINDSSLYYVKLASRSQSGKLSEGSVEVSGTPQSADIGELVPPKAPTSLTAVAGWQYDNKWFAETKFDLTWSAVTENTNNEPITVTSYEVWVKTTGDFRLIASVDTTSFTVSGLGFDTPFTFVVRAVAQVAGEFSSEEVSSFAFEDVEEDINLPFTSAISSMSILILQYVGVDNPEATPPAPYISQVEFSIGSAAGPPYTAVASVSAQNGLSLTPFVLSSLEPGTVWHVSARYKTLNGNYGEWLESAGSPVTIIGVVPENLDEQIQDAIDNAGEVADSALTAANSKNIVTYSTSNPSADGVVIGDTWFKRNGSNEIIGQWEWDGSDWLPRTLENAMIATLDAAKINVGTLSADRIGANTIAGEKIIAGTITSEELATNAVTAGKINAGAIDGMIITGAVIQTDYSGQRVVLDAEGIHGYNSLSQELTTISSITGALTAVDATFSGDIIGGSINIVARSTEPDLETGDGDSYDAIQFIVSNASGFKVFRYWTDGPDGDLISGEEVFSLAPLGGGEPWEPGDLGDHIELDRVAARHEMFTKDFYADYGYIVNVLSHGFDPTITMSKGYSDGISTFDAQNIKITVVPNQYNAVSEAHENVNKQFGYDSAIIFSDDSLSNLSITENDYGTITARYVDNLAWTGTTYSWEYRGRLAITSPKVASTNTASSIVLWDSGQQGGQVSTIELIGTVVTSAGRIRLTNTGDASATSTGHALQIGLDSGANVIFDNNEIIGRNNGVQAVIGFPSGISSLPTPTGTSHAVNKAYVDGLVADTGWVNVTIASGYAAQSGFTPQVRKIGKVVYFRGGWSNTGMTAGVNEAVGTVPSGYRPSLTYYDLMVSNTVALSGARFAVTSAGGITIGVPATVGTYFLAFGSWLTD